MKKIILTIITLTILFTLCFSTFANAEASYYLDLYGADMVAEGNGKLRVSFDVFGTGLMTSIGVTQIEIQKKVGSSWVTDSTLKSSNYPSFLASNSYLHSSNVRITGVIGT